MGYSYTTYTVGEDATVGQTVYNLSFTGPAPGYLSRNHVYLFVNGVEIGGAGGVEWSGFNWLSSTQVELKAYSPVNGDVISFRRIMPKGQNYIEFSTGFLSNDSLNDAQLASLYMAHEIYDGFYADFSGVSEIDEIFTRLNTLESETAQISTLDDRVTDLESDIQDIIDAGEGIELTSRIFLDSYDELRSSTHLSNNDMVYVKGRSTPGDGGCGIFHYVETDTTPDDDGIYLSVVATGGCATRQFSKTIGIDLRWYGVVGDGKYNFGSTAALDNTLTIADSVVESSDVGKIIQVQGAKYIPIVGTGYQWSLSDNGTSEYFLEAAGGGDPYIIYPSDGLFENATVTPSALAEGTLGSLAASEWAFGDNDNNDFYTIYVRLSDSTDPDTKVSGYVAFAGSLFTTVASVSSEYVMELTDAPEITQSSIRVFWGTDNQPTLDGILNATYPWTSNLFNNVGTCLLPAGMIMIGSKIAIESSRNFKILGAGGSNISKGSSIFLIGDDTSAIQFGSAWYACLQDFEILAMFNQSVTNGLLRFQAASDSPYYSCQSLVCKQVHVVGHNIPLAFKATDNMDMIYEGGVIHGSVTAIELGADTGGFANGSVGRNLFRGTWIGSDIRIGKSYGTRFENCDLFSARPTIPVITRAPRFLPFGTSGIAQPILISGVTPDSGDNTGTFIKTGNSWVLNLIGSNIQEFETGVHAVAGSNGVIQGCRFLGLNPGVLVDDNGGGQVMVVDHSNKFSGDSYVEKIIPNGGFESGDFTNWTQNASAISSSVVRRGSYSCSLTATGTSINGAVSDPIVLNPTSIYNLTMWRNVTAHTAGVFRIAIEFYSDYTGTSSISDVTVVNTFAVTSGWQVHQAVIGILNGPTTTLTVPSGTLSFRFKIQFQATPTGVAYVDDFGVWEQRY